MAEAATTPNATQIAGWDGSEGDAWTEHEDFYNDASKLMTPRLIAAAALRPNDRVLDVGCGCGQTTRLAAAAAPQGRATGMDLSSRMLHRARERAAEEGIANATFIQGDAQVFAFEPASFDIAISRFGVMFFDDPGAAFANIGRAVAKGGRLAMLVWREFQRNDWVKTLVEVFAAGREMPAPPPDVPSPFALADPARTERILTDAGFGTVSLEPLDEGMWFGPDVAAAYASVNNLSVAQGLLAGLEGDAREQALKRAWAALEERERPDGVWFGAAAWLIRATKVH